MKAKRGQSIIDIAVQTAGNASAAITIARDNNRSITDQLASGSTIAVVQVQDLGILPATDTGRDVDEVERVFFEEIDLEFT